ncbi:MAG: cobaltochelatase subunit CobN [Micropruina sp.]|uniref:cobaltochelatase subunit CobN n=1 Tax=Micropruina sp. TaxID=2737536 RepID=UPI0039E67E0B
MEAISGPVCRGDFATDQIHRKNPDSAERDIADSDDHFQYRGGMVATVWVLTGADPKAYVGDSTSPDAIRASTLADETAGIFRAREGRRLTFTVRVGAAAAHAIVGDAMVSVGGGEHLGADLVIAGGAGFRDVLAGTLDPVTAVAEGAVDVEGEPGLLEDFVTIFNVPYSPATAAGAH